MADRLGDIADLSTYQDDDPNVDAPGVGLGTAPQGNVATKPGVSMNGPEYGQVGPWFRESVATPMGMQAVPAQGFTWGAFAPQTGVDTAIGAPKLELLARSIWERAQKLGIDPATLRDKVLMGQEHAVGLGTLGAAAAASQYGQDEPQPYFQ